MDADLVEQAIEAELSDPYPMSDEAYRAQSAACSTHDTLDALGGITSPTLVLVGAEDILTPPYFSREIAERIPGAVLKVLDRGGHGAPIEHAVDVNAALLEFLRVT